jgi:hypothetical protein
MKKSSLSLAMPILVVSLLIIGFITILNFKNNRPLNDNKSKLTLIETIKKVPVLKNLITSNKAPIVNLNVLTEERVYTEKEITEMSEEQFIDLLKETERRLPKNSDIKPIPTGALYHTPEVIIATGRDLSVIKEVLKSNRSYERLAAFFYANCAQSVEGITPVRALCLTNLIEIKKKNNENVNLSEYPDQLIQLSRMVIDI